MSGQLEVIVGSMFSGKTEELIRRARRAVIARRRVLICKPDLDRRYHAAAVASHDGRQVAARVIPAAQPEQILALGAGMDVVAVDEAQFFGQGVVAVVMELVRRGCRVIVSGLDMDFAGRPFPPMPELMALADEVTKLRAICARCGEPATFTQRFVDGRPAAADDPLVLIGGREAYEPRCRRCHELAGPRATAADAAAASG